VSRPPTDRSDLTPKEQDRVRAALRFLRLRCGTWETLAKALRFKRKTVQEAVYGATVSASLTFRVARLAGVPIDDLLGGRFPPEGTCPYCGHVQRSSSRNSLRA
jgi:hypothetical protein